MLTLPNKNLSGTIRNGEKDSLRYSKINQKPSSRKQIGVVRMAAAASPTPSLCQLRHAAGGIPRTAHEARPRLAETQSQTAAPTTSAHPTACSFASTLGSLSRPFQSRCGVGSLCTRSLLCFCIFILLVKHAGALRCIVSASVKSVLKPKALINNSDEARKF